MSIYFCDSNIFLIYLLIIKIRYSSSVARFRPKMFASLGTQGISPNLPYYGSASRFTHGAISTASYCQFQNERRADDGSTEARLIPVFDFILAKAIVTPGVSRKNATCFVAATIIGFAANGQ